VTLPKYYVAVMDTMTNKTILVLAITAAFVAGTLTSDPFAEAAEGWKGLLEIKQSAITSTGLFFTIVDPDVTSQSVVIYSIDEVLTTTSPAGCGVATVDDGSFDFACVKDLLETGSTINYIVITP